MILLRAAVLPVKLDDYDDDDLDDADAGEGQWCPVHVRSGDSVQTTDEASRLRLDRDCLTASTASNNILNH